MKSIWYWMAVVFSLGAVVAALGSSRRDEMEFTILSCQADHDRKTCLEKLHVLGVDGWQIGASTFANRLDETTFWLQRKKQ